LSGLKQSENGDAVVVRFWNPSAAPVEATVRSDRPVVAAHRLSMEELDLGVLSVADGKTLSVPVRPKEIVTLGLRFGA
jgi:alpha-mannosidase